MMCTRTVNEIFGAKRQTRAMLKNFMESSKIILNIYFDGSIQYLIKTKTIAIKSANIQHKYNNRIINQVSNAVLTVFCCCQYSSYH